MRTAELGCLVGYSTQQVRDLERLGIIPPAEREGNGYRRYGEQHLIALRAYRALAASIGPVPARQLMPRLRNGSVDEAAETIDELHSTIASARARVREARRALDGVLRDVGDVFDERDAMTISELAHALGVRTSAIRHWEHEGLVTPARDPRRNRRYESNAIADARLVAALRSAGYPIPAIAQVLDQLRTHGMTSDAQQLLDARLADLTRRSVKLLEAASELHGLLRARMPADSPGH
jgi:DNA-binding transcriptional MerR regulator